MNGSEQVLVVLIISVAILVLSLIANDFYTGQTRINKSRLLDESYLSNGFTKKVISTSRTETKTVGNNPPVTTVVTTESYEWFKPSILNGDTQI